MITISLCMIVKDEEKVLGRCLESIKDAVDEIIIVDTGSTDTSKEIARKYTDKVYDFKWIYDFSAARNEAFSKATMEYQMWLDADDVVPEEEVKKLIELKKTLDTAFDIVTMKYFTHFDENNLPIFSSTRGRLFKRSKNMLWNDPVHEYIPLTGKIFSSDITIHHKKEKSFAQLVSTRNIDIYENLEKQKKEFTPRQQYYFARELKDHGRYAKAVYYFTRFLEEKKGWFEDNISTCYSLGICYSMLNQKEKILPILFKSFEYAPPRAEICCQIGYHYKDQNDIAKAYEWFKIASTLETPNTIGFILKDYWGYIPNVECCVCACHFKQFELAYKYNEKAAEFKPNSKAVLQNRTYLKKILNK